jgi:hypothetical protein
VGYGDDGSLFGVQGWNRKFFTLTNAFENLHRPPKYPLGGPSGLKTQDLFSAKFLSVKKSYFRPGTPHSQRTHLRLACPHCGRQIMLPWRRQSDDHPLQAPSRQPRLCACRCGRLLQPNPRAPHLEYATITGKQRVRSQRKTPQAEMRKQATPATSGDAPRAPAASRARTLLARGRWSRPLLLCSPPLKTRTKPSSISTA